MTKQVLQGGQQYFYDVKEIKGFFGPWRFLSNFHYTDVEWEGMIFRTTEHAYQAAKFADMDMRRKIQFAETPLAARRLGQSPGCNPDWEKKGIRDQVMMDLSCQKYAKEHLGAMLLESGNAYLEETNHWGDVYWGVCNGVGENKLGKILMDVRGFLRGDWS
jgi:ribA/ribD-fused uncharacterized protein